MTLCACSCVFMKVCKVDEGQFDLQNSTYLETGAREDLKPSARIRLNISISPFNAFIGK